MSGRDLVVLGTASQAPTRTRNHNGYLLRWDGTGVLFDPGEGTQRQLTLAGVPPTAITRVCLTHLHGDHCLGLPGILQRLALDGGETGPDHDDGPGAVPVAFPASGRFPRCRSSPTRVSPRRSSAAHSSSTCSRNAASSRP